MGITVNIEALLKCEHDYRPFEGDLLSIGKQSMGDGCEAATDHEFWARLSGNAVRYRCLDVSDFEGADLIWDLCKPLPAELENSADIIFNGSCLDNVFDPAMAMRNFTRLLRPGGRIIHTEHLSRGARLSDSYTSFSAAWFWDYYALNRFSDCKVYLGLWSGSRHTSDWRLYFFQGNGQDRPYDSAFDAYGYVIAEKSAESTWSRSPVQWHYRAKDDPIYVKALSRFAKSQRPIVCFPEEVPPGEGFPEDGYIACGCVDGLARRSPTEEGEKS